MFWQDIIKKLPFRKANNQLAEGRVQEPARSGHIRLDRSWSQWQDGHVTSKGSSCEQIFNCPALQLGYLMAFGRSDTRSWLVSWIIFSLLFTNIW